MWFTTGVVLMYVPFPKLTDAERYQGQGPLRVTTRKVALTPGMAERLERAQHVRLHMQAGQPVLRVQGRQGGESPLAPSSGADRQVEVFTWPGMQRVDLADAGAAIRTAQHFLAQRHGLGLDDAQRIEARRVELAMHDQWSVISNLNPVRPLHRIAFDDADGTELYVSAVTGAVELDTARVERGWNWIGAVLHWIYPTVLRRDARLWRDVVTWLSLAGVLSVLAGIALGLWRWLTPRTGRDVQTSRHLPPAGRLVRRAGFSFYKPGMWRWHHILGLSVSVPLALWIASGLFSMNPWGVFSSRAVPAVWEHALAGPLPSLGGTLEIPPLTRLETGKQLRVYGLDLVRSQGRIRWLAQTSAGRHLLEVDGTLVPEPDARQLAANFSQAVGAPLLSQTLLTHHDTYWPSRRQGDLPVWRLEFADAASSWLHVSPGTGQVLERLDASTRAQRWVYNIFHSWDTEWLWNNRWARDPLMILASALGLAMSVTGIVLSWRRLKTQAQTARSTFPSGGHSRT